MVMRRSPSWSAHVDEAVRALAAKAGIASDWTDAAGKAQRVSLDSLRGILNALGFPAATAGEIAESRAKLARAASEARDFITAEINKPIEIAGISDGQTGELLLESGE